MSKNTRTFVCQSCGAAYKRWQGQCGACQSWNTIVEEVSKSDITPQGQKVKGGNNLALVSLEGEESNPVKRFISHIGEWDRVCGGGIVPGSAVLIGGDPGIGKSTVLLQVTAALAKNYTCAYISGEESIEQIRLRAQRLGVEKQPVQLGAASNLRDILATLDTPNAPSLVVIDSIQTLFADVLEAAPGTVSQVRFCAQELVRLAKKRGFSLILVGHVTKEGTLAGPRVLEHMVDAVLYFEGDRGHQWRILRTVKNRFGATDEIGVFAMTDKGLEEISNPSALFLTDRQQPVSGAAVFAGIEGTRPILVEIQALVAQSPLNMPRRTVVGWDSNRLAMVLAVLETRCQLSFAGRDVYLNIAGGLRVTEPAADMAVAAALVSALKNIPLPSETIFFGEVALSGEIRSVAQMPNRVKESERLGFKNAITPVGKLPDIKGFTCTQLRHLRDVLGLV